MGRNQRLSFIVVTISMAMTMINIAVVAIALPDIGKELVFKDLSIHWVINAFILSMATFGLIIGKLCDIYNLKKLILIGLVIYTFSTLGCFYSYSALQLISFRAIQGLAHVLFGITALKLMTEMFHSEKLCKALGLASGTAALMLMIGPPVGGYIAEKWNWHWVFFLNLPFCILAFGLVLSINYLPKKHSKAIKQYLIGFALVAIFLFCFNFGVMEYFTKIWNPWIIRILFIISFISLFLFINHDIKSQHPILHLKLLNKHNFIFANLVTNIGQAISISVILWVMYAQIVLKYSAAQTGIMFLPLYILAMIFSYASGYWIAKKGTKQPLVMGMLISFIGCLITSIFLSLEKYWTLLPALIGVGISFPLIINSVKITIINETNKKHLGTALGLLSNLRLITSAISFAIFSSIFVYFDVGNFTANNGSNPNYISNFEHAFQVLMIILTALGLLGLLASISIKKRIK